MIERGCIYLANLGKKHGSEMGKRRPVLVMQTNILNRVLGRMRYNGIIIMPLTTNIVGGDLRVFVPARDSLEKNSEVCVSEIYTIDANRIMPEPGVLTRLKPSELQEVEQKMLFVLGMIPLSDLQ